MNTQRQENFGFEKQEDLNNILNKSIKVTPSDRELEWDKSKVLSSKTDIKGNILYANEAFIDICGYDDYELINQPHSLLRHPDMPKVIFKLLWENLQNSNNYTAIFKNMSKTGRFYWVVNEIKCVKDSVGNTCYTGLQKSISPEIVTNFIEPLYKKLLQIEQASGLQASENYLIGFLEEKNKTFLQYINTIASIINQDEEESIGNSKSKKGFFSGFFADNK